jgi:hypothetical protein
MLDSFHSGDENRKSVRSGFRMPQDIRFHPSGEGPAALEEQFPETPEDEEGRDGEEARVHQAVE